MDNTTDFCWAVNPPVSVTRENAIGDAFCSLSLQIGEDCQKKKAWERLFRNPAARIGLFTAAGLLFSSCAGKSPGSARDLASIGEVPARYKSEKAVVARVTPKLTMPDRGWVQSFGDTKLSALVEEALDHNKDLQMAAARLQISEANAKIAGADLYPKANGIFKAGRFKRNFIGFPFGSSTTPGADGTGQGQDAVLSNLNNEFGLQLDMSWEVDLWGRIRAGQSAAIAEYEAAESDRKAAELSIAAQTAKTWFSLLEEREQLELAEKAVDIFRETEKAIRERFEAGIDAGGAARASQLRLAMTDVENAREMVAQRNDSVKQTMRQLELLLGRYPEGSIRSGAQLPGVPGPVPAGIPAELLDRRPDIQASERRLAAADQRVLEAKKALLPAISLSGNTGTSSEQIEDILNSNFSIWSVAGNAMQPILAGGALRNRVFLRHGEVKKAVADFEKTALNAFGEVENALESEAFLAQRERALRQAAEHAREAYLSASEEFEDGTGDILTMLSAQNQAFSQMAQHVAVRRQQLENRVDLHLALGGNFAFES